MVPKLKLGVNERSLGGLYFTIIIKSVLDRHLIRFIYSVSQTSKPASISRKAETDFMKRILLVVAVIALYVLHQDIWYWRTAHPLVFGFVPIGLFYQGCFSGAASLLMWLLVKYAWPVHLEQEIEHRESEEGAKR